MADARCPACDAPVDLQEDEICPECGAGLATDPDDGTVIMDDPTAVARRAAGRTDDEEDDGADGEDDGEPGTVILDDAEEIAREATGGRPLPDEDADTRELPPGDPRAAPTVELEPDEEDARTVDLSREEVEEASDAPPPGDSAEKTEVGVLPEGADRTSGFGRGDRVGKYEVESFIAAGGMGAVYKAKDVTLGRTVALKIMKSGALASEEEKARFLREAEAAAQLQHPNIVGVYDSGFHEGNYFFTMDHVEGQPLDAYVNEADLDVDGIFALMARVADAVAYAHLRGIIHRDLKPSNILVDDEGEPHVMDFGLAKQVQVEEDGGEQLTLSGVIMGTPHYMSPEQAEGLVKEIDVRSDIYSLGVILYQLVGEELPFQGGSLNAIINQILLGTPTRLGRLTDEANYEVEAIVEKAMAREKDRRYQSARDLVDDLEAFVGGRPVSARRASVFYRARKFVGRHTAAVALSTVAAVAVLSLVGYLGLDAYREANRAYLLDQEVAATIRDLEEEVGGLEERRPDAPTLEEARAVELRADMGSIRERSAELQGEIALLGSLDRRMGNERSEDHERSVVEPLAELEAGVDVRVQYGALDRRWEESLAGDVETAASLDELDDLQEELDGMVGRLADLVRQATDAQEGDLAREVGELHQEVNAELRRTERRREALVALEGNEEEEGLADRIDRLGREVAALRESPEDATREAVDRLRAALQPEIARLTGYLGLGIPAIEGTGDEPGLHGEAIRLDGWLRDLRTTIERREEVAELAPEVDGFFADSSSEAREEVNDPAVLGDWIERADQLHEQLLEYRRDVPRAVRLLEALERRRTTLAEAKEDLEAISEAREIFDDVVLRYDDDRTFEGVDEAMAARERTIREASTSEEVQAVRDDLVRIRTSLDPISHLRTAYETAHDEAADLIELADRRVARLVATRQAREDCREDIERARDALGRAEDAAAVEGDRITRAFEEPILEGMTRAKAAYDRARQRDLGDELALTALALHVRAVHRFAEVAASEDVQDYTLAIFAVQLLAGLEDAGEDLDRAVRRVRREGGSIPEGFTPTSYVANLAEAQAGALEIRSRVSEAWSNLLSGLREAAQARAGSEAGRRAARAEINGAGEVLNRAAEHLARVRRDTGRSLSYPRLDAGREIAGAWTRQQAGGLDDLEVAIEGYREALTAAPDDVDVEPVRTWLRLAREEKLGLLLAEVRDRSREDRQAALDFLEARVLPFASGSGLATGEVEALATSLRLQTGAPEWAALVSGAPEFAMPVGNEVVTRPVEPFYVGVTEVRNVLYKEFVADGGYDPDAAWWADDPEGRAHLAEFKDATGRPGPASWADGTFPEGAADLPVTGISWYEARAFCRWYAGETGREIRLPREDEWARIVFHRGGEGFEPPWRGELGDWDVVFARPTGRPVPSTQSGARYAEGVVDAVRLDGGPPVLHLFGNVQEWVAPVEGVEDLASPAGRAPVRGGCYRSLSPDRADPARRVHLPASWRPETVGFRVVATYRSPEGAEGEEGQ